MFVLERCPSYASVNSTSAHSPRATRGIWSGSLSRRRDIFAPRGATLLEFDTRGFKKARAVKMCVLFLRDGGFCGKRYGFQVIVVCPQRTRQALRFLEVSFLILESFPVLCRSNYLSYIIYRKIKETYAANNDDHQRSQSGLYNASFCEFKWVISI